MHFYYYLNNSNNNKINYPFVPNSGEIERTRLEILIIDNKDDIIYCTPIEYNKKYKTLDDIIDHSTKIVYNKLYLYDKNLE